MFINKIKNWLRKHDLEHEILSDKLDVVSEKLNHKALRPIVCDIDLSPFEENEMSESERREYCASISGIYPRLEKDINKALYKQLERIAINPVSWDESLVFRGEFSGMDFLKDHWRKARDEHNENLKPEEKYDKHNVVPEIE